MKIKSVLVVAFILFLLVSTGCKHKEDIAGRIDGTWQTQWEDMLSGDVDEISVDELIEFTTTDIPGLIGTFRQLFQGDVKFDDWINESELTYSVFVSGKWFIKDKDNIVLVYDLNEMVTEVGKSDIEPDYTDAGVALLFGDWSGAISSALSASNTSKLNQKIEKTVKKEIESFFREMFHDINKDKKAMTDVVIQGKMMTCDVNHGFFGREQTYDRIEIAE